MIEEVFTAAAGTAPMLIAVLVFLIYQERVRQENIYRNHKEWGERLKSISEHAQLREDTRNSLWINHLEQWQTWMDEREQTRHAEFIKNTEIMTKVESRLEHLATLIVLVYAAVQAPHIVEDVRGAIEKGIQNVDK